MSKRNSVPGSPAASAVNNTLFRYFAKSPAQLPKSQPGTPQRNPAAPAGQKKRTIVDVLQTPKLPATDNDDDEDEDEQTLSEDARLQAKKRRRIAIESDEDGSDAENIPANAPATGKKAAVAGDESTPSNNRGSFMAKLSALQSTQSSNNDSALSDSENTAADSAADLDEPQSYTHQTLEFLRPDRIRDSAGRRPDHPEYDPTTLLVPPSYLDQISPGMRQWWLIKATHFDCVLFFKVGKFYELYHMDADVGVRELGFAYMRGEFAHSGFPEKSYDRMAVSLVERGYKVARTEQTETPDAMTERVQKTRKPTKFDRVVRREVCQITDRGTQVYGQQVPLSDDHQTNYMLALAERHSLGARRFGVCFIDTSIAEFRLGEFDDDQHGSRLLTLLAHHRPVLVLSARGSLSLGTQQIVKRTLSDALHEQMADAQLWRADRTLKQMAEKYFRATDGGPTRWPDALRPMQDDGDHLGITPDGGWALALSACGACISYMQRCLVDEQIMAQARFATYSPPDAGVESNEADAEERIAAIERQTKERQSRTIAGSHMVLDAISVGNLRLANAELSLELRLDQCCTKFGRRLLHAWICTPSCRLGVLQRRQAAVADLMADQSRLQRLRELLAGVPDLERLLAQIHTFGNGGRAKSHPDSRAILFEQHLYNKKKIGDFLAVLNGFDKVTEVPAIVGRSESELLRSLTRSPERGGEFPDMREPLEFYRSAFDHGEALRTGQIAPAAGVDAEFDAAQAEIRTIDEALGDYLCSQEKRFGCRLAYFGADKKRFQLEVPESNAKRADRSYQLEGQKKGSKPVRRFSTAETRELLRQMLGAEDRRNEVVRDLSRRMFERFSAEYATWKQCLDAIGQLDVLGALAAYGHEQTVHCFPELIDATHADAPVFDLVDGYHPCMNANNDFIPNGVRLGGQEQSARLSLLTGPNMGGKSTMMRQVGLLAVMAQLGGPVPARRLRMSLVDRIFTRLGAHDDIMAGHSTFLVELNETATILRHATRNSLVLLDELGRGTATYDGTAIAAAVVDYLAGLGCRTMFSTHYHNLVEHFQADGGRVRLGHMACMVENETGSDDPTEETVTFLYKYTDGACPKSYGFNAAKLAGMSAGIIRRAHELSKKVEREALQRKIFAKLLATNAEVGEVRGLLANLQQLIIK